MSSVRKKFILYAMVALFVLLTVLLAVINGINYTMAGEDADEITQMIARERGSFNALGEPMNPNGQGLDRGFFQKPNGSGPMGPDSPEVNSSVRYFTFKFDKNGEAKKVAFHISALTESEALELAESLKNETTGWVRSTYRYRVYKLDGEVYVTVIDQGREILSAYRILIISIVGEIVGLIISFAFLVFIGKRLFRPLEEADGKQKKFIAEAESEFKVPLTIINANAELIEKENGSSEYTKTIHRQVKKMTSLIKNLGSFAIIEEKNLVKSDFDLSGVMLSAIDSKKDKFAEKGIAVECDIENGVLVKGDFDALSRVISELVENALKFAQSKARFELMREDDRVIIRQSNDTELTNVNAEQIFDRFTRLENAEGKPGSGLGLSYIKDSVKAHNGRLNVKVNDGLFTLQIRI